MTITDKIKAINNKFEQSKAQFDLDGQTAKISASSSGNVSKYFFNWQRCFNRKRLIRKSCCNQKI